MHSNLFVCVCVCVCVRLLGLHYQQATCKQLYGHCTVIACQRPPYAQIGLSVDYVQATAVAAAAAVEIN
jgi:hypothetical protein